MDYANFRESERAGWDARADGYERATARATRQSIPALLSHAQISPGARVLDAGCGPGYVAAMAALMGAVPTGIDFAASMVRVAQTNYPDISFEEGDVENLPFDDGVFDAVISNIVLFHVTDPARAFSEACRVLAPNGVFAFSQWLGPDKSECYKMLFDVMVAYADMTLADPAPNAYALSDQENVQKLMETAGFHDIHFETVQNVLYATGDSFFDFFMTFGVRVPLILDRQTDAVKSTIRAEINRRAAAYRVADGFAIPMPSLVVSGRRG